MEKADVFMSSKSQPVRLPKPVALPADVKQVEVIALGRACLISPVGESWDQWIASPGVTEDFMNARDQPADQVREFLC